MLVRRGKTSRGSGGETSPSVRRFPGWIPASSHLSVVIVVTFGKRLSGASPTSMPSWVVGLSSASAVNEFSVESWGCRCRGGGQRGVRVVRGWGVARCPQCGGCRRLAAGHRGRGRWWWRRALGGVLVVRGSIHRRGCGECPVGGCGGGFGSGGGLLPVGCLPRLPVLFALVGDVFGGSTSVSTWPLPGSTCLQR